MTKLVVLRINPHRPLIFFVFYKSDMKVFLKSLELLAAFSVSESTLLYSFHIFLINHMSYFWGYKSSQMFASVCASAPTPELNTQ